MEEIMLVYKTLKCTTTTTKNDLIRILFHVGITAHDGVSFSIQVY